MQMVCSIEALISETIDVQCVLLNRISLNSRRRSNERSYISSTRKSYILHFQRVLFLFQRNFPTDCRIKSSRFQNSRTSGVSAYTPLAQRIQQKCAFKVQEKHLLHVAFHTLASSVNARDQCAAGETRSRNVPGRFSTRGGPGAGRFKSRQCPGRTAGKSSRQPCGEVESQAPGNRPPCVADSNSAFNVRARSLPGRLLR